MLEENWNVNKKELEELLETAMIDGFPIAEITIDTYGSELLLEDGKWVLSSPKTFKKGTIIFGKYVDQENPFVPHENRSAGDVYDDHDYDETYTDAKELLKRIVELETKYVDADFDSMHEGEV